jgi:GNAT superfamily N-acetyltransferase/5'(3')-deoxyribonucleotidase
MGETGVADVIGLDVTNADSVKFDNPIMNLAMLSDDVGIGAKWKMSNDNKTELAFYIAHKNKKLNQQDVEDMISDGAPATYLANVLKIQGQDPNWAKAQVPQFPVTGKDLIALGIKSGPNMGIHLAQLKQIWQQSRFKASKEDLLKNLADVVEGKSPHKKGTPKYKKHMAAMHAGMNEATNMFEELSETAELYVDMDGVLADFFGGWAKLMGVNNWKDIKDVDLALNKIKEQPDFWVNLPLTSNALQLLSAIKAYKGRYNILSAPLQGDTNSKPQKMAWIKKNLSSFPPQKIILDHNKAKYAKQSDGTPNGLIDDYGKNIASWTAAGGIAIKHEDANVQQTIDKLDDYIGEAETLKLPNIDVGDEVMVGKFKNRKATVKGFDKDDNNQPVLKTNKGDQKLFKPRIRKLMDYIDESVNYVKPQFDVEWEEANRYPYLEKLGPEGWEELAKSGREVSVTNDSVKKIGNTGADGSESLDDLEPDKVARLKQAMELGTIEMPIVVKQPDGSLELVAGNTRLIGLISTQSKANVWLIDASRLTEAFKPHMMYDPKTGEGKMAKVEDDHLRMKKMGWGHDKPTNEAVEVDISGNAEKGYVLSKIVVPKELRGTGVGSKVMKDLIDKADNEHAIIALTPDTAFGGAKGRLIQFYKRFGFVPNKGRNKDFRYRETMIRYPKEVNKN